MNHVKVNTLYGGTPLSVSLGDLILFQHNVKKFLTGIELCASSCFISLPPFEIRKTDNDRYDVNGVVVTQQNVKEFKNKFKEINWL